MSPETLAAALEREHHEIDEGIEAFLEDPSRVDALTAAMAALRRHIYLEEAFLFPPLRDGGMVAPIFVMVREQGEIWNTMDALEAELAADPAGAATSLAGRALLDQLASHNAKEEPIVYPQADAVLSAQASAELQAFIADGRLPDGWVCAQASG